MSELFTDTEILTEPAESVSSDLFTDSADILPEVTPETTPVAIPTVFPLPESGTDETGSVAEEVELLEEIVFLLSGGDTPEESLDLLPIEESDELPEDITGEEDIEYTLEDVCEMLETSIVIQNDMLFQQVEATKVTNGILITILFALSLAAGFLLARIVWRKL